MGFYSSSAQPGIALPEAGTNYQATTYQDKKISVTPGGVVCQWTSGGKTYYLYESISVELPLAVGSWYIRDFYGFGYNPAPPGRSPALAPTVYVWVRVEKPVSGVQKAELILYRARDGARVATVDLTQTKAYGPYTLYPGEAFQIDLVFDAGEAGAYSFRVGFYASQKDSEAPR